MADSGTLDDLDRAILALLIEDGRRSLVDIAERVSLSPAPVKRRVERLERLGVITGYTALVDHGKLGAGLEAFVELRFAGDTSVEEVTDALMRIPEVQEIVTVAGDPDALARVRLDNVAHLREVIDRMREGGRVIGTKTLMVVGRKRRGSGGGWR
ncbi:Lrp/AsnC family transcriptional regulator [Lentzea sp. DG1S-22]|uniref:Lrp/AsnC family transcriptional regulator n=1 Tax=Lentzea sp. DG1S-22 TaxID=3108822 RepID=UPI002E794D69|nr:Lrp/AsnC family transcriptional regulator [Lentzea sp. DG1S-22]WVH81412.1 Lrp/AsnC family transcriptional regulator [Lentzea sp. DG1S-22]